MKEFHIEVDVTYRAIVTVEAEEWEEAFDIAEDMYYEGALDDKIDKALSENNIVDHDIRVVSD